MNETNKEMVEREREKTYSTSAFHEHLWWIAIVVRVVAVLLSFERSVLFSLGGILDLSFAMTPGEI